MSGPKAGEIWKYPYGNAGDSANALILNTFTANKDVYVVYLLVHRLRKDKSNISILLTGGEGWVDPHKLSFAPTKQLLSFAQAIPDEKLYLIRAAAATAIGLDPGQPSDLEMRFNSAMSSAESMKAKIAEQAAKLEVYQGMVDHGLATLCQSMDTICERLTAQKADAPTPEKEPDKPESNPNKQNKQSGGRRIGWSEEDRLHERAMQAALIKRNRETNRYPLNGYIKVRCEHDGIDMKSLSRLLGYRSGAVVCKWANGNSAAKWDKLERLLPGILEEAQEWARNNKKSGKRGE